MRNQSTYAIYSANESATQDGQGFWNIRQGWVDEEDATLFTAEQADHYALPMSLGQDRQWVNLATMHEHWPPHTNTGAHP